MQVQGTTAPLAALSIDEKVNVRRKPYKADPGFMESIRAKGIIDALVVRPNGKGFKVINGGRRLTNLLALKNLGEISDDYAVPITLRDENDVDARDTSLMANIIREDMHPIEIHRALKEQLDAGRSVTDLAHTYTMTEAAVRQSLALGGLSPLVQDYWLTGKIKAELAKAFTLAPDHKTQDRILKKIEKDYASGVGLSGLDRDSVINEMKVGKGDIGVLVEFVGAEAYRKRGGEITEDLFGHNHKVSDPKLVQSLAAERLEQECEALISAGWSFALPVKNIGNKRHEYSSVNVSRARTEEDLKRLQELDAILPSDDYYGDETLFKDMTPAQQSAFLEKRELERAIELRGFTPAIMARSGCFVDIDDNGMLDIEYGKVKPAERKAAETVVRATKAIAAAESGEPERKAPAAVSNALKERMAEQLVKATKEALSNEKLTAPIAVVLQTLVVSQIRAGRFPSMADEVRNKLSAVRDALTPALFNAAITKHFDAKDYFESSPKPIVLKAIEEAVNKDEARKLADEKKPAITKFAIANVIPTRWLPKELRTIHYPGPVKPKAAVPAAKKTAKKTAAKKKR